ncbi:MULTISPECIES: hypothetical protein [unclassified Xanthomonas]|uniref:hypothetical protein n=1 Tax=unclassified Xanthomonas TaxID=2643310 RepID=UPI00136D8A11|nr:MULTISPECIES: hypothetical protein [unclassified Xanthomonas]MBB5876376.1 hypothetical protein [Xanthomonas sp. 3498]MBB5944129.1 hypothetical protein [Xanthomonas sp. 3307]MXV07377.1 hypothetical protein [Xanthomonas sp. LMG 9002]
MSCDERSSAHASSSEPVADPGPRPVTAPRQPGHALRRLETLAQAELRQLLIAHTPTQQDARIADPVWAGLAWDMGLNGSAVAAAGTPAPPVHFPLYDGD